MSVAVLATIQVLVVLAIAPYVVGVTRWFRARLQNRAGASPLLPYWTIATLFKKERVMTRSGSWVFRAVPVAVLASAVLLALLVPAVGTAFGGDIFLVAAVLAIGAVALVLGGMDTASAFGGMGASREMTLAALVEPVVVLVLGTLALATDATTTSGILAAFSVAPWYVVSPFLAATILALACVVLSENARYPVDNPATHLELTMVHEAMVLEYSGPELALLEFASAVKMTVLALFLANVVAPFAMPAAGAPLGAVLTGIGVAFLKVTVAAGGIALLESVMAKMRFYRMQEYMMTAYCFALVGLVFLALA